MKITTERLLLRPVTEEDLASFHRLQSNPHVTKWTKQGPNKTLQRSEHMLDDLLVLVNTSATNNPEPTLIHAITLSSSPPDLIGLVGTFRPREIGFSLHPDYWGRGYAQEATIAFCRWYSARFPGQALFAKVDVGNEASVKCLTRCGFSRAAEEEGAADEAYGRDGERQTWLLGRR